MTIHLETHDESLFEAPQEYALASLISKDLKVQNKRGLTYKYIKRFGRIKCLSRQLDVLNMNTSRVLMLRHSKRNVIYYLITKPSCYGRPSYANLRRALTELAIHMKSQNITKLAIPKLGCGKNLLDWRSVKAIVIQVFTKIFSSESDKEVNIAVYSNKKDNRKKNEIKGSLM
jgi:hypothetical protein